MNTESNKTKKTSTALSKDLELRPIRAKNIRKLLKDEHLTQKQFGEILGGAVPIDARNISKMLSNGKITADMCSRIHKAFPKYSLAWLLGEEEYPTQTEKNNAVSQEIHDETVTMHTALFSLAKLSGFKIEMNSNISSKNAETLIRAIHGNYITFSRDGKKVSLSVTDLNRLENKLCDYVEFELIHMCE